MSRGVSGLRQANVSVDLDPVISHLRMHDLTCRLRDDYVGFFDRHVAMNALVHDLVPQRVRQAAALPLMAGEALL